MAGSQTGTRWAFASRLQFRCGAIAWMKPGAIDSSRASEILEA
jgi:hypothetical protein